jgi:hypothetical protein
VTTLEPTFGQTHFGACDLGHQARSRCLVRVADAIHRHPGGTLPHKLRDPAAYKAMGRLMNRPEVTHPAVLAAHREQTLDQMGRAGGPILVLHDTTELDYSGLRSIAELGSIGGDLGRGYLCHNSLAYDPAGRRVLGLAHQALHRRRLVGRREGVRAKRERADRESRLWPDAARAIGPAPAGRLWVHVADRGADTFEHLAGHVAAGRSFVIRSLGRRMARPGHAAPGRARLLRRLARALPVSGSKPVAVGARGGRAAQTAVVGVGFAAVTVHPPHVRRGEYEEKPLRLWLVVVRELEPPRDRPPVEWVLLTNVPVRTEQDAWERAGWYECRWVIEEYHKAQKTGCAIEPLQFTSAQALEPMIALLSVVAVTLLALRDAGRDPATADRPAEQYVDRRYVAVLTGWRYNGRRSGLTVREFYLALGRLGGHQNRTGDRDPGWIVLWRGWMALQHMLDGADAVRLGNRG